MKKLNIIIVDDNTAFRKGLKFYLENECGHKIIAEAQNGRDFLEFNNIHNADIVLMDIQMPEKGGYETTIEATIQYPKLNVIAITSFQELAYVRLIIESGFKGCVFKDNIFFEIENAINEVVNNSYYIPEGIKL